MLDGPKSVQFMRIYLLLISSLAHVKSVNGAAILL